MKLSNGLVFTSEGLRDYAALFQGLSKWTTEHRFFEGNLLMYDFKISCFVTIKLTQEHLIAQAKAYQILFFSKLKKGHKSLKPE